MNPTHISETIKNKKRQIAGKRITCRACSNPEAWICLTENRLWVRCGDCGGEYLLKEQHN